MTNSAHLSADFEAGHWQFYKHFGAGYCPEGSYRQECEGPVASKRWRGPHSTTKPNKLSYRWRYSQRADGLSSEKYTEKLALRYVQWLAQRDGLTIPSRLKSRCVWSGFTSKYKTRTIGAREWREARTQEAYCRRVQAVEWGREEERYATRKDGLRGAWTHNEWVAEFRIDIPHWDFEHPEPVDEGTP